MMKKISLSLFLLLCSCYLSAQLPNKNQRLFELSQIWRDVSENFCNPQHLKAINFDSIYCSFLPKVEQVDDELDYYYLLQEFMAKLNDGHSQVLLSNVSKRYDKNSPKDRLAMDLIWNGNNLYVSVIEKSKAEQIPLGSRIIAIDGIPAEQYLENNIYKYISDNTLQHKRLQAIEPLMTGKSGDSISFVLLTPQQQERTVFIAYDVMQRKVMKTDLAGLKASRFFRRSGNDTFLVDHENFNFYYFKPHGFTMRSITNYIKDAMPKLEKADYVVLDLRNNEGGSELQADTLLACFIDCKELRTYKSLTRSNNAFYRAMGYGYPQYKDYYNGMHMDTLPESIIVKKELPLIRKPLFILISEETYSAAEDLLVTLKLHYPDRAILVGKPTGGSSGAPLVNRLSNEVYYRICTRKALLPEGMFENGVQPDYDYEPSIQELISGEDFIFKYVQQLYRQHYENK